MSYGYKNDNLSELEKLNVRILNFQLAFENYEDNLNISLDLFKKINEKTDTLWHHNENLSEEEKINLANDILIDYKKIYDSLPDIDKNRFTFKEDGSISYMWTTQLGRKN